MEKENFSGLTEVYLRDFGTKIISQEKERSLPRMAQLRKESGLEVF